MAPYVYTVARLIEPLNTEMLLQKNLKERASSKRRSSLVALEQHAFLNALTSKEMVWSDELCPAAAPRAPCRFGVRCSLCNDTSGALRSLSWVDVLVGEFPVACHTLAHLLGTDAALCEMAVAGPWPAPRAALGAVAGTGDAHAHALFATPRIAAADAPRHAVALAAMARVVACALMLELEQRPGAGSQRIATKMQSLGHAHIALYEEVQMRAAANERYDDAALLEIVDPAQAPAQAQAALRPSRLVGARGAVVDLLSPRAAPHYEAEDMRHAEMTFERRQRELPLDAARRVYGAPAASQRFTPAHYGSAGAADSARHIVRRYARAVLAPLAATERWLAGAPPPPLGALQAAPCERERVGALIAAHFARDAARAFPAGFWQRFPAAYWLDAAYDTLTAAMLRIVVCEQLHDLEPATELDLRFALRLVRNSHIDLIVFLASRPYADLAAPLALVRSLADATSDVPFSERAAGVGGAASGAGGLTFRDALDPLRGERALHEGDAPRLGHGYEFVNLFADCGLSAQPFNHMKYKLAPRCCGCREFDRMHDSKCVDHESYFHLTTLELELSLCGLYRHALVAPTFWQTLRIVSHLRRRDVVDAKKRLLDFQLEYPQLAEMAGAEAMVRAIATTPHHRALLCETYPAWVEFERASRYNGDVVRHVYSRTGSLAQALAAAYAGPEAAPAQSVYRHQPHDYIRFMCDLFKREDKRRYVEKRLFDPRFSLTEEVAYCIDRYVASLVPNEVVNLTVLRDYFGLSDAALRVHERLQSLYLKNATADEMRAELYRFSQNEYIMSAYFFERVRVHNNVRVTQIASVELKEAQLRHVREMCGLPLVATARDLVRPPPPAVGKFVVAPCCSTIKTPIATCMDSHAHGTMNVAYDPEREAIVCVRKDTRSRARRASRGGVQAAEARRIAVEMAAAGGAASDALEARLAAAQQQERSSLPCHETPCAIVPGIGYFIEPYGYHAKRKKKNRKSRRPDTIPAVHVPPFWIAPCCGIWNSYRMECWTANGYVCGACRGPLRIETRLRLDTCIGCGTRATIGERLGVYTLFDDVHQHALARYRVCKKCAVPLVQTQPVALSLLRQGVAAVNAVATADE